jgi:hypothetical protein
VFLSYHEGLRNKYLILGRPDRLARLWALRSPSPAHLAFHQRMKLTELTLSVLGMTALSAASRKMGTNVQGSA